MKATALLFAIAASLSACCSFPVLGHSRGDKANPAPSGEQRAYAEYCQPAERQTLFHAGQQIESHVP